MRRSLRTLQLTWIAAAAIAAIGSTPGHAATVSWLGGTSFWDVVTSWSSNPLLPGAADDVVINVGGVQTITHRSGTDTIGSLSMLGDDILAITGGSLTVSNGFANNAGTSISAGTLTLNGVSAMAALTQSGGVLAGAGTVTIAGPSSWLAGTHSGTGITQFDNAVSISGPGAKLISGGRTVNLNGTTTWGGNTAANNNSLQFANGTLNNAGTFNDQNAFASFIDHVTGTNAFNNIGTYNKQSNTVTTVEAFYNNTGTTNVNAGTMLMQGTSAGSGAYKIAAGATLEFRNGSHTLNNPTISGAGTFVVSTDNVGADAVVTLNGGTLTSPFLFSGSAITGTNRVFQAPSTWTGGSFAGTAVTTFQNDVAISGPNLKVIVGGGTVNLNGTTTWSGNTADNNNAIRFWNGATINNNGTFNDANAFASFIEHNVGGPHNFNNIGTYNKLANTITTVDLGVAFNNTGVVNVNAGILRPSGGTNTGVFNIANGAKLDFRNGNNTLTGVTTTGPGTLEISSDLVGADAVVAINGGTHTTSFALSGSTLTGTDNTFQGVTSWTGGAIAGAASTTFANDVTISGVNTKLIFGGRTVNLNGTTNWTGNTAANNNAIQFWNGGTLNNNGTFNDANAFASFLEHNVGGPHNFNNNGTYNKQANTLTTVDFGLTFNNSGTVNLNAGTMRFFNGIHGPTGTVNVASGATLQQDAASTVGNLVTAGNLVLADRTMTVFIDYDNANFGSGNAFNRRANVSTTGIGSQLVAGGNANQGLTGANIVNGNSTTPSIVVGNVRVGATTFSYDIANTGTTGPALRGAIQDAVNGGHISDARLSGNGVVAGNWGPVATGQSTPRDVIVTIGAAGVLAPFVGQAVNILNNFDNTRSQLLTFTTAAGAAAYQPAAGQLNTPALNFGTVQVGQEVSQVLSISNVATGPAGFVEDLNARFGAASGTGANRISGSGSIANLAAGGTNSAAMTVHVDTQSAGTVNGAIAVDYFSAGTVNGAGNGLAEVGVGSSSFSVAGAIQAVANVINRALPVIGNTVINLGNVRVGAASPTQAVGITNQATVAPQAALNATVSAAAPITAGGSVSLLAPGASSNNIVVGMQTGAAGAKNGTATISFVSDASNVGNCAPSCQVDLPSQNVSVSGNVYRLASPTLGTASADFVARVGDPSPSTPIGVTNTSPDIYTERLNGSFASVASGFAGSGTLTGLAAGASSNALALSMNTGSAGSFAGTARLNFVSSGAGTTGAADADLGSRDIALSGRVYTPAVAQLNTPLVDFGIVHKGELVAARNVSVTNAAAIAAPNDVLKGSLGGATGPFTASGSFAAVAAQASDNSSLGVGLDTASAGIFNGSAVADFSSHNAEMTDKALPAATVTLKAQVNNFAELTLAKLNGDGSLSSATNVYTLDFGTIVAGANDRSAQLGVFNTAVGPADLLNGSFSLAPNGAFSLAGFDAFADLVAGGSRGGLDIVLDSASTGVFSETITVSWFGTNASGYRGPVFDSTLVLRGTVIDVAAVPEPQTYLLMLGGLVAVFAARRRQAARVLQTGGRFDIGAR